MAESCFVTVFDDLDSAKAFRNLLLKENKLPDDLWEFWSLPIIISELSRLPLRPDSARIFGQAYPIAYARIIQGLDFLISEKVDAINLSLCPDDLAEDDPLAFAVEQCLNIPVFIVVAAGNAGPSNNAMQPLAKIPGVISVGAVDDRNVLLPLSSRGPEGGDGPTVVSYGRPEVIYIKEGWGPVSSATSFAAPKVTRVYVVILKAMQLLWTNYQKIRNSSWDNRTTPLPLSKIGFADTGIDPDGLPPLPERVAEHLRSNGEFVSFTTDQRQRDWFEKVHETFHSCPMMDVTTFTVRHALETIATPLPYFRHEVGAGVVSFKECYAFLKTLTPTRFIQLFSPFEAGTECAKENANLDAKLGPLWDLDYVNTIIEFFYYGARLVVAKVI